MKDFLLITNKNCITYNDIFPRLRNKEMRLGHSNIQSFLIADGTEKTGPYAGWITTLSTPDKPKLVLTKTYNEKDYPRYDNYDAIEVGRVKDIPIDYDGLMGVPITILEKDLECFEIVGIAADKYGDEDWMIKGKPIQRYKHPPFVGMELNGKHKYARVLIRRKGE